MRILEFKRIYS